MRDERDIQRAHDIMHAVAAREVLPQLPEHLRQKFHVAHDVLAWVLNGPCGYPFAEILVETLRELELHGYTLVHKG